MKPKPAKNLLLSGFFLVVLCLVDYEGSSYGKSKAESLVDYEGSTYGKSKAEMLSTCNGSISECNKEGELLMESYISHRILEERRYISYGALKKDQPACGSAGRGQPYRSCYPDPSNPYSRGCSKIYRCRDDS